MSSALLEVRGLSKRYGRFHALEGVDLGIPAGQRRALIGPNGAGKSTFLNIIGGQSTASAGTIRLAGRRITGHTPHDLVRRGIARTFQISRTLPGLSVRETVLAALLGADGRVFALRRRVQAERRETADALLERVGLAGQGDRPVTEIAHGDRKRLEFAMVLAARPRLLLLDEPTAGMGLQDRHALMDLVVAEVAAHGMTLLFVEHDIDVVFRIADLITVMARGRVLAEGTAGEIRDDPEVRRSYLGEAH